MVDLISLLPDTAVRRVVVFCLNDCHLTLQETQLVLFDASRITQAVNLLLEGRIASSTPVEIERAESDDSLDR